MKVKFTPSVNIVRDTDIELDFISTSNTVAIARTIFENYQSGIHAFNLIGSYGTGKSAFFILNLVFLKDLNRLELKT